MAKTRRLSPVHPGEVLCEELMNPLGLSISELARELSVPVTRMRTIVNGRRGITADIALRLARYFATTPEFWMNLQATFDLDVAMRASSGGTCIRGRLYSHLRPRSYAGISTYDDELLGCGMAMPSALRPST